MIIKIRRKDSKVWHYYEYNSGAIDEIGMQYDVDASISYEEVINSTSTSASNLYSIIPRTYTTTTYKVAGVEVDPIDYGFHNPAANFTDGINDYVCKYDNGVSTCIQIENNYYTSKANFSDGINNYFCRDEYGQQKCYVVNTNNQVNYNVTFEDIQNTKREYEEKANFSDGKHDYYCTGSGNDTCYLVENGKIHYNITKADLDADYSYYLGDQNTAANLSGLDGNEYRCTDNNCQLTIDGYVYETTFEDLNGTLEERQNSNLINYSVNDIDYNCTSIGCFEVHYGITDYSRGYVHEPNYSDGENDYICIPGSLCYLYENNSINFAVTSEDVAAINNWGVDLINQKLNEADLDGSILNGHNYDLEVKQHIKIPIHLALGLSSSDMSFLESLGITNMDRNAYVSIVAPVGVDINNIDLSKYDVQHFFHGWGNTESSVTGLSYMLDDAREYINDGNGQDRIAVVYNLQQMFFSPAISVEQVKNTLYTQGKDALSPSLVAFLESYLFDTPNSHVYGAALTVDPTAEQLVNYFNNNTFGSNIDAILDPSGADVTGHSLGTIMAQHYMKTYNELNNTNVTWNNCQLDEPPSQTSIPDTTVDLRYYDLNIDGSEKLDPKDFFTKYCGSSLAITGKGSIAGSLNLATMADYFIQFDYGLGQPDHDNTTYTGTIVTDSDFKLPIPHLGEGLFASFFDQSLRDDLMNTELYSYLRGTVGHYDSVRGEGGIDINYAKGILPYPAPTIVEERRELAYLEVNNLPVKYLEANEVKYLSMNNCTEYKIYYGSNATNNMENIDKCTIVRSDGGADILGAVAGQNNYLNGDTGNDELYSCASLDKNTNPDIQRDSIVNGCTNNATQTLTGGWGNDTFYISEQGTNGIVQITDFRSMGDEQITYETVVNGERTTVTEGDVDKLVLPAEWAGAVNVCNQSDSGISICDKNTGKVLAEVSGNIDQDLIDGINTGKGDRDEQLIVFGEVKNGQ